MSDWNTKASLNKYKKIASCILSDDNRIKSTPRKIAGSAQSQYYVDAKLR